MSPCFERDLEEDKRSQATGETGGRGRESPGVPTFLDFNKLRTSPKPFYEFHPVMPLTQPRPNFKLEQNQGPFFNQPPYPYQQGFVLPPQYLDPSLLYHKRSSPPVPRNDPAYLAHNAFPYGQPRLHPQTPEDMPSYHHPMQHLGAIPKRISLDHKSPPDARTLRELFPYSPPSQLESQLFFGHYDPGHHKKSLKAQSPKVLMSRKSSGQTYYPREDQVWGAHKAMHESVESDGSSPEIDKFLRNMTTPVQPLSPEEIQNYLFRLNQHQVRSRKDINQKTCRSFTEKDFADAELSSSFNDGAVKPCLNKQNLPAKMTQVLQEANKDQHIQKKYATRSSDGDDLSTCDTVIDDDRSLTPTPTRSPRSSVENSPPKLERTKEELPTASRLRSRSSSPQISNLSQRVKDENKDLKKEIRNLLPNKTDKAYEKEISCSPADTEEFFLAETTPHPAPVPAVQNIRKTMRPMSPLTKKLKESDKENESQVSKVTVPNSPRSNHDDFVVNEILPSHVSNNNHEAIAGDTSDVHILNGAAHSISNGVSTTNGATEGCELKFAENGNIPRDEKKEQTNESSVIGRITFTLGGDEEEEEEDNESVYCTPPESPIHIVKLRASNKNNNRNESGEPKTDTQESASPRTEASISNGMVNLNISGAISQEKSENQARGAGLVKQRAGSTGLLKNLLKKDLSQQIKVS